MGARAMVVGTALALALAGCGATDQTTTTRTVTINVDGGQSRSEGSEQDFAAAEKRCPGASEQPETDLARAVEATLCLINHERDQEGLAALSADRRLRGAAQRKAEDMVDRTYFEHVGPDGKDVRDWVRGTGYLPDRGGFQLGENIAWAGKGGASPARIVEGWMNSPTHRRNILAEAFAESGIGIVEGAPKADAGDGITYAHFFGSRKPPR